MHRSTRIALVALLAASAGHGHGAAAQVLRPGAEVEGTRPALAGRVVRLFDFEEQKTNPLPVPQHWFRAQQEPGVRERPGFPPWNAAELDYTVAYSGQGSVRLPASGGSASLRLGPGVIPVFPGADYTITCMVRTSRAAHARARLTARFLDASGRPLEGTQFSTPAVESEGGWRPLSLQVRGTRAESAFLQVDLELLQPRQHERAMLPEFKVWPEDFEAVAWFDDVRVSQLPRVELAVGDGSPIVRGERRPTLRAMTRDLTGQKLLARFSVRGLDGTLIDSAVAPVDRGPGGLRWTPRLPGYGLFDARLELFADGQQVGASVAPFAWLAEARGSRTERDRFVIFADGVGARLLPTVPGLVSASGAGAVVVPAWYDEMTAEEGNRLLGTVQGVVDALLERRVQVTLALGRIPEELASRSMLDPRDTLRLIATKPSEAEPYLLRLIDRYGQSVQRWLFGSTEVGPMAVGSALDEQLTAADATLARYVPGPIVTVPWDGGLSPAPAAGHAAPDGLVVQAPTGVGVDGIGDWLGAMADALAGLERRSADPVEVTLLLEPRARLDVGREAHLAELVKHGVGAWGELERLERKGVRLRLGVREGLRPTDAAEPSLAPTPSLGAIACLAEQLAERRLIERIPTAPGTHAYLFGPAPGAAPGRGGLLVAWADSVEPGQTLDLYLGADEVTRCDVFMNRTPIAASGSSEEDPIRTHRVALGTTPVFIENVDVGLVSLAASLRMEPPFIPATNESHERTLVLRNPFDTPVSVRYFIARPGMDEEGNRDRSWSITPRSGVVQIPPRAEGRVPITVVPSYAEEAGAKQFVVDAQVTADRAYGWVRLSTLAELGLPGLKVDVGAVPSPGPGGPDIVVDVHIANVGEEPLTLDVAAFAPDMPRQRSSVSDLPPGASALRRFVLPNGVRTIGQERIIVSVTDTATGGRLNTGVSIEQAR